MGFLVMHRVLLDDLLEEKNCQIQSWRCSVADASGCGPHRDNNFVRLDVKPKCHGSYPVRGCQSVDERNVYGFGPRIERGEARGDGAERCRWVVERRGLPLPLLEQTLPFAAVGRVPGEASFSRQNGSRCGHVDADGQKLALAIFQLSRSFSTWTGIKVAMNL